MDDKGARIEPTEQPFQSLYRRFRPQRFSELLGQEHVVLALRNAVRDAHVSHAYLFSGPRGTGKTSAARILAKALNCTAQSEGEPCGTCAACLAITAGNSFDVHELDAASNNGVDAMRDLVARAALSTPGSWKVYIVDEVHMLSTAASNALLKTLEEPPDHVVFVLATTDPQKVLPTIRSRTQHFEFHLIGEDTLQALLSSVAQKAALELPTGAIEAALRRAKGSARDALSYLDQVAAAGVIDDDDDVVSELVLGLASSDPAQLLVSIDTALRQGRDPQQLAIELIDVLRVGFLMLVAPASAPAAALLGSADIDALRSIGTARCVRTLELLGAAIVAMRDAPDPRVTLEVALVRAGHVELDESLEALTERIERIESRVSTIERRGDNVPAPLPAPRPEQQDIAEQHAHVLPDTEPAKKESVPSTPEHRPALGAFRQRIAPAEEPTVAPPPDSSPKPPDPSDADDRPSASKAQEQTATRPVPTRDELVMAWGDHIVARLRPRLKAIFLVGRFIGVEGNEALLALPNEAHVRAAEPLCGEVAAALSAHFSTEIKVRLVLDDPQPRGDDERPRRRTAKDAAEQGTETAGNDEVDEVAEIDDDAVAADSRTGRDGLGFAWAESRLLQAFPGAEELST